METICGCELFSLEISKLDSGEFKLSLIMKYPLESEDSKKWNEVLDDSILLLNFFRIIDEPKNGVRIA